MPIVSGLSHKELDSIPGATCDDPVYKASPASPSGWPSGSSKPCSWDGSKVPQEELEEEGCSSTSSDPEEDESSGSSSHSSTGFGKGAKLDPDKSVVLSMENMSQTTLKVCHPLPPLALLLFLDCLVHWPELHVRIWQAGSIYACIPMCCKSTSDWHVKMSMSLSPANLFCVCSTYLPDMPAVCAAHVHGCSLEGKSCHINVMNNQSHGQIRQPLSTPKFCRDLPQSQLHFLLANTLVSIMQKAMVSLTCRLENGSAAL